jgi:tRNA G18 (ribose-2'-O)-methylase SpoU
MTTHQRHKPPTNLERPRELVLACPQFKSSVNLSRIVRLAGCVAVNRVIVCGSGKVDSRIARDAAEIVQIERRNSLPPVLRKLCQDGYQLVGLEQTDTSQSIFDFQFDRKTVLVIGHERLGVAEDQLALLHACIEIPVYGMPYSYNVVTATTMAVYEYCKQFPSG